MLLTLPSNCITKNILKFQMFSQQTKQCHLLLSYLWKQSKTHSQYQIARTLKAFSSDKVHSINHQTQVLVLTQVQYSIQMSSLQASL
jgi:hypothetical protein